ncbi:hypothetical protein BU065_12100 [Staphylococcus succinus]|uniref:hypothetical protein n=1 Tax=Staphylococcus succinus TaxID=61015 RepID=UPI000935B678|nr:hypothetical protein [Staphylococcus succinus]MEB8125996.1 hypothetical protein [Staphylococcus succinus]MEB8211211.1 hypothetical protein [Staphylococcus succinus]PTI38528.1 hypothetical protein BU062_12875 [Staphylococcus succinus]PTJ14420.1 hypothetical protein BU069_12510 [Staphylococcus succinus]RIN24985.1 hypothetical protein BU066_11570 [Staphylococcus succinus]
MAINLKSKVSIFNKSTQELADIFYIPNDHKITKVIEIMRTQNLADSDSTFLKIYDFYFCK